MTDKCVQCGFPTGEGHVCPVEGQGMRHNAGKPRTDLIPAIVLIELGKHYEYGARKYKPNNWLTGFPYSDTYASLTRHLFAWWAGERNDPENGHHHLIAVIWNAIALFYFELFPQKYASFDDRPIVLHPSERQGAKATSVPYDDRHVQGLTWTEPQGIPPTVPIPDGYAMLRDGQTLTTGDMYMTSDQRWANVLREDIGMEYNADRMGPVIRPTAQSESIKIPAQCQDIRCLHTAPHLPH